MKKIFTIILFLCLLIITGCGKDNVDSAFKDLTKKINKLNGYSIEGKLNVKNNNNDYSYNVVVNYKAKDKYKVSLINTSNNHEQVILRNDDGVFVLTPSLNKSFKFQSDWPYNNSQVYILNSIIDDLNKDQNIVKEEKDGKYIFKSKVNFPNNNKLVEQIVTVSKDLFIEKVEILNSDGVSEMIFEINSTDYNPTFDESFFEVNSIINTKSLEDNEINKENKEDKNDNKSSENSSEESKKETCDIESNPNCKTETKPQSNSIKEYTVIPITMTMNGDETKVATLEDVVYPLYLPNGTVLKEQEKVEKTDGERVILTFSGDKGFTLVEETAVKEKEFTIIPTYGEPGFINDTIGAITDNSLNWISNGVEYYMVSDVMNTIELMDIANSINVSAVMSLK